MSDYQIDKLIISDHIVISDVGPRCTSNYFCSDSINDLFKYDLTFSKNKKSIFDSKLVQIKYYPIDFNGEQLITKGIIDYALTIEKVSRFNYIIKFDRKK